MDGHSIFDDAVATGAIRVRDDLMTKPKAAKVRPEVGPAVVVSPVDPAMFRWTVNEDGKPVATGLTYADAEALWKKTARDGGFVTIAKDV